MVEMTFVLEDLKLVAQREPAPNWTVQVTNLETGEQSPIVVWSDSELQAVTHLMIGETAGDPAVKAAVVALGNGNEFGNEIAELHAKLTDLTAYQIAEPLVANLGSDFRVIP